MAKELREAFDETVKTEDWLDEETRKVAREKLKNIQIMVGPPKISTNFTLLDEFYNHVRQLSST